MPQFRSDIGVTSKAVTTAQGILIGTQTTMPQASAYNVGCTVLYAGSAGTYTPGRYYTCVGSDGSYSWQEATVIATGADIGTANRAVATDGNGMIIATDVTAAELGYLSGVTSGVQSQLNGKVPVTRTVNGKPLSSDIVLSAGDVGAAPASAVLTASRALQSSSNGEVTVSNVTAVELSYLSGVTSAIQAQLDGKAASADIPTLLSQLTNDTGFITNAVSDLINYYTKDETYTRTEINNMVSAIPKFAIQVVASLPSSGISATTIYLTPNSGSSGNSYDEFIYVNNQWEQIGSTAVDLSDYYTKAQVNAMVTPVQGASGITINGVSLQSATSSQPGLMTVAQVGQLATAVSNAQSALNGNVTGGTFSNDSSGNLTLTLNRGAGALNVGPTALTAAKAIADGNGANIASTYATTSALNSGLAGKADAGTEITGGAFSNNVLSLTKAGGGSVDIPFEGFSKLSTIFLGFRLYYFSKDDWSSIANFEQNPDGETVYLLSNSYSRPSTVSGSDLGYYSLNDSIKILTDYNSAYYSSPDNYRAYKETTSSSNYFAYFSTDEQGLQNIFQMSVGASIPPIIRSDSMIISKFTGSIYPVFFSAGANLIGVGGFGTIIVNNGVVQSATLDLSLPYNICIGNMAKNLDWSGTTYSMVLCKESILNY